MKLSTLTKVASSFALVAGFLTIQINTTHNELFLPENDMKIPVGIGTYSNGMTEQEFNDILDQLEKVYEPVVNSFGANLQVKRLWDNPTVNASAQQYGNTWILNMYGGLARHDAITADGFFLVACHEMGHHLGGAPKISSWFGTWASNEGQSDYFATLKCLRRVFLDSDNLDYVQNNPIDSVVEQSCRSQFATDLEYARCARVAMAGLSVASLFKDLRNETNQLDFSNPDRSVVSKTDDRHPDTQCRLDTYFQGSLCDVPFNQDVSQSDYKTGTCYRKRGDQIGLRPLCWFKPSN